jgi:hypothetical protein
VGSGVLQDVEVRGRQVGEPARVQAGEHAFTDDLERHAQQRTDERRGHGAGGSW